MDAEFSDLQLLNMQSMQERPVTLGELLRRTEESLGLVETPRPRNPVPRPMERSMSPTGSLGPLVGGRPHRPRGRTLTQPSTSTSEADNVPSNSQPTLLSQQRRRYGPSGSLTIPALARWRYATAEARIRNFHTLMNEPRHPAAPGAGPGQHNTERADSLDFFFNPFSWQRRRRTSSRSSLRSRSVSLYNIRRSRRSRVSRIMEIEERSRSVYRCRRTGRPHSGRADPETWRNTNENPDSEVTACARRFIDFFAEFIPVREPPENAEPPEWSLDVTAADLGPFAVGRSALSRARSLAVIGALSQVNDESSDAQANHGENNE